MNKRETYSSKDVEHYVRLSYRPKRGRSIERSYLLSGLSYCFIAILLWITSNVFMPSENLFLLINTLFLLLTPIVVLLSIKVHYYGLNRNIDKGDAQPSPYLLGISTLGAVVGKQFARFLSSNVSDNVEFMIYAIMLALFALLLIFVSAIQFHTIYLIREYCPHISDSKKRRAFARKQQQKLNEEIRKKYLELKKSKRKSKKSRKRRKKKNH